MKHLLYSAVVLCLFLTGCETYQPAVVGNGKITNTTVGFEGYELTIPPGLHPAENMKPSNYVNFMKKVSEGFIVRGGDQTDTVVLQGHQKAVAFIVGDMLLGSHATYIDHQSGAFTTARSRYGLMTKEDQIQFLAHAIERINPDIQTNVTREVVEIGGRPIGVVMDVLPELGITNYTYLTLGKLNEVFIIIGVSPDAYAQDLKKSMDQMVASLKVF